MYNPELKNKFISQYTFAIDMRKVCMQLFNMTEGTESNLQSDLCTLSGKELQPIIDNLMTVSGGGSRLKMTILRSYFKWCADEGYPGAIGDIRDVSISNHGRIKRSMVSSPLQLQKFLNMVYAEESLKTLDNCKRCVFWMAFGGLSVEDICKVSTKDVILEDMIVSYNGKEYPIYREGMASFKNCKRLTQFVVDKSYRPAIASRSDGNCLVRGLRGDIDENKIRLWISAASRKAREISGSDIKITHYSIWLSGLFYRMYEAEQYGGEVNFLNAAIEKMGDREYKYSENIKQSKQAMDKGRRNHYAKEYLNDYYNWKDAFGL